MTVVLQKYYRQRILTQFILKKESYKRKRYKIESARSYFELYIDDFLVHS